MLKVLNALQGAGPGELAGVLTGHETHALGPSESLSEKITRNSYNIVLFDGPIETIPEIKRLDPRVEVFHIGDRQDTAMDAIKSGASAYFTKPVDAARLLQAVETVSEEFLMRRETAELESQLHVKYTFAGLVVGKNPKMLEIFALIRRIAPYYTTVLIYGETGTGKDVIAKALHKLGTGDGKPFVVCNAGALTETLIESELFGHKKGSFTGAISDKIGLFEAAEDGNIFLDEIGELPITFQPKFLRVLQDGEFRPVGSNKSLKAKCRVIAATNRDLSGELESGRFRRDLYYRITPLVITLPPLRDRKDDIPLLSRFFIQKFNARTNKIIRGISRPAQAVLMEYGWPGNVRELENTIEQAAIMTTESFIRADDIPASIRESKPHAINPLSALDDVVRQHIENALKICNNNRTKAAKLLKVSRRALLRKMDKYSIQ